MKTITICSFGDLMLCDSPLYVSVGLGSSYNMVKDKLFECCRDIIHSSDIVIGNLEGPIYTANNSGLVENQMAAPDDAAKMLSRNGFNIINLANNHCLQHGCKALLHTEKALNSEGIQTIGFKERNPLVVKIQGIRFLFLSLSLLPERYHPDEILYNNNIEDIFNQIHKYKKDSDYIVLSIHWGNEFALFPHNKQVKLAHKFIDEGVNLILGHHSHTYQGIEKYNGALILYSQGNYVSDMKQQVCRDTGIAVIKIHFSNHILCNDYTLLPIRINDGFIPVKNDADWFTQRQEILKRVLQGDVTEEEYWNHVDNMHTMSRKEFKAIFRANKKRYRMSIYFQMIIAAVCRRIIKVKRSNQFLTTDRI